MDSTGTLFMPPGRSTIAGDVDALFNFIMYASLGFFLIVVVTMIYFVIRYRRRGADATTPDLSHNLKLELIWSIVPTILVIIVFFWGFNLFMKMSIVPHDAYEVKVTAQQWFWSFSYPNGNTTVNELTVPAGRPVKLLMSSQDVIHSLFVPDFRIKMDVLPNRYTMTWFEAPETGTHNLFCAEYCGTSHSEMIGLVKVLTSEQFDKWLEEGESSGDGMTPAEYGQVLFKSKACNTCHKVDGVAHTGPALNGIMGISHKFTDGTSIVVDENYIRESVLNPQTKIVEGFQPVMPTFQGILSEKQIDALIAYLKSLEK